MYQQPPRPLPEIDEDLRLSCVVRRAAEGELAEIRRRQAELAELEATLLTAIEARCTQADRLLDERLRAHRAAGPLYAPAQAVGGASTARQPVPNRHARSSCHTN
jgi:hypothetical protein